MAFDPTAIFTAIGNLASMFEKLSPAINEWIEAAIPAEKQRIITRRIKRCQRYCRVNKLPVPLIEKEVDVLFPDLPVAQRTDIIDLLDFELSGQSIKGL
ncbi:MAG TPA: hypothetical protein VG603_11355 [Chitinophagales bacterium]|nr:hypothetical protein [Chitinophagales bacterium]